MRKKERDEINAFLTPFMEEINFLNQRRIKEVKDLGKVTPGLERKLENLKKRIKEAKAFEEERRNRL
jgi:hypothetical protein